MSDTEDPGELVDNCREHGLTDSADSIRHHGLHDQVLVITHKAVYRNLPVELSHLLHPITLLAGNCKAAPKIKL
jgi:hypothetical protein